MSQPQADVNPVLDLAKLDPAVIDELAQRVKEIDHAYRAVAQKMGQLYMFADEKKVAGLTAALDKPMRNASDNEQTFAGIVESIRMHTNAKSHGPAA